MAHHSPPPLHSPDAKRPKGILKNSASYQKSPVAKPTLPQSSISTDAVPTVPESSNLTEKDIVLHNTLQNAGPRRRSSSNAARIPAGSRRHSSASSVHNGDEPHQLSPRLKWDEANLYLTEQDRTPKMKIDEPKTPFAKHYDPAEDEEEMSMLDAQDLVVDELDAKTSPLAGRKKTAMAEKDIPDLDLGEPEEGALSHSPKQVVVRDDYIGSHHHGDVDEGNESPEEVVKHRKFEEARRKHYEMKDVASLLGHPEKLDIDEEDGDTDMDGTNGVPEVPQVPAGLANGRRAHE